MYGNLNPALVPTIIAAGLGESTAMSETSGTPSGAWLILAVLCAIVGMFALIMSAAAAWRMVPVSWRRAL